MRHAAVGSLLLFALAACGEDGAAQGGTSGGGGGGGVATPWTVTAFEGARVTSDPESPTFQRVAAELDLGAGPFADVRLDLALGTTCFPFEGWQDNPPPDGHNWPADCDAFDRNFEISLHDPGAAEGTPGLELVRAITPFGGPMTVTADLTDAANFRPGVHRLEVRITTWSDAAGLVSGAAGGWTVDGAVTVTPGTPPRTPLAIVPLFYASDADPEGPGPMTFQVPEGVGSGRIEYRVTGHGGPNTGPGCIGPAEEFCRRQHEIAIDGAVVGAVEPWRTDCALGCTLTHYGPADGGFDYCAENPCGLPQSVRASRANWCPGSVTPPLVFDLALPPGAHDFAWRVHEMLEGGSWTVSATYLGFAE